MLDWLSESGWISLHARLTKWIRENRLICPTHCVNQSTVNQFSCSIHWVNQCESTYVFDWFRRVNQSERIYMFDQLSESEWIGSYARLYPASKSVWICFYTLNPQNKLERIRLYSLLTEWIRANRFSCSNNGLNQNESVYMLDSLSESDWTIWNARLTDQRRADNAIRNHF